MFFVPRAKPEGSKYFEVDDPVCERYFLFRGFIPVSVLRPARENGEIWPEAHDRRRVFIRAGVRVRLLSDMSDCPTVRLSGPTLFFMSDYFGQSDKSDKFTFNFITMMAQTLFDLIRL